MKQDKGKLELKSYERPSEMQETLKTPTPLIGFLMTVTLLLILSAGLIACKNSRPEWTAKFWAGDSNNQSITRAQDGEHVFCEDKKFDDYVCISYKDLEKLETEVLTKCKAWVTGGQNVR